MSRREKIDCPKAEADSKDHDVCRWCGRQVKRTHSGKIHHRRGYRRIWDDPRKKS